jgi:DNA-binding transcriptional ArsR family regulator
VKDPELALIHSDPPEPAIRVPLLTLIQYRQAWAFAIGKFMTDPIWWLYLFWIPDFLNRNYGINLTSIGPPLITIYVIADVGSIAGGWLSSALIKRGWAVNAGRKTAMLVCALAVVPMALAAQVTHLWVAVGLVGLAAAAHQGWSANLFTLTSDMFPRQAVGSVVGFGGMAGAVGGLLIAKLTGYILETTGSYVPVFLIAASTYLAALGIIHLLVPRLQPAKGARFVSIFAILFYLNIAMNGLALQEFKAGFFRALAHPTRIRILETLGSGERSVQELQQALDLDQPIVSQQLAILRGKNVVTSRKVGTTVRYALSDPLITKLLSVAREIFNNHLVDTQSMLKALRREARRS